MIRTKFCQSAVPCPHSPDFTANFLEVFLGDRCADGGASRDVTEVNIELVSATLYWQERVDGAECVCLHASASLYQHLPSMHTHK